MAPPRILPDMRTTRAVAAGLLAAASLAWVLRTPLGDVEASESGPPPARTGGFGETTCLECHWDNPINDAGGWLRVSGLPQGFTPGQRYTITVSVSHPELTRAGFELSVRFDDGTGAGSVSPRDRRSEIVPGDAGGVTYVRQTREGAMPTNRGEARWTFDWIAPTTPRPVRVHAAANAANGDASPLGDFVYTTDAFVGAP